MNDNNKMVQILSMNIKSDHDYQKYTMHWKSPVVHEISGRIQYVLNQQDSMDGVFRFRYQIAVSDIVSSDS